MKNLLSISLAVSLLSAGMATAQPEYDRQKQYRDAQNYHDQLQRAYAVPSTNYTSPATYKSPSSSTSTNYSSSPNSKSTNYSVDQQSVEALVEKWRREKDGPSAEEKAASALLNAQYAAQQKQVRDQKEATEARRLAFCRSEEATFMQNKKSNYNGILSEADQREMNKDAFFCTWVDVKWQDYGSGERAYELFLQDADTASFDRLLELAWQTSNHPFASSLCYSKLLKRFPGNTVEIEKRMLYALPYYFGAHRPLLSPKTSIAYPEAAYEDMSEQDRDRTLALFMTLAEKYPDIAQKVSGQCRSHINPFYLSASKNSQNSALAAKYYLMYLRSDNTANPVPKYGPKAHDEWEKWADTRIRPVADWLVKNSPSSVHSLTTEDWQNIAKMQNMKVDLIAWAFRDDDADAEDEDLPHYWKRFPALAKARKLDK